MEGAARLLSITAPVEATIFNDPTPAVAAEYSDAVSGIDLSSLRILIDGSDITSDCTAGAASAVGACAGQPEQNRESVVARAETLTRSNCDSEDDDPALPEYKSCTEGIALLEEVLRSDPENLRAVLVCR